MALSLGNFYVIKYFSLFSVYVQCNFFAITLTFELLRFDTGDDGIVFSSGNTNVQRIPFRPQPPPPTERAVVCNVSVRSHSSAIKFEVGEEREETFMLYVLNAEY